ncbi:MAG: N-acetylmuramoyl-L-alanine amidase [Clostridia bacterium]|nr:N-acetylmuramoyl-L-alanine amidase [Clostridia bacterium]
MQIKEAALTFDFMTKRSKTDLIVLHHAAAKSCSVQDVHRWHLDRGWSGIGYHFFIRKDGSVWRGRPEDRVGAHTVSYNANSIGVCFEGNFENEPMGDAQKKSGFELIAYLKAKYPIKDIKGHGELKATACPGKLFPLAEFKSGTVATQPAPTNRVLLFQRAALADGFKFLKYGTDGMWGSETESVAKSAVVRRRDTYKYKNLTRLVQGEVGVAVDGLCGKDTENAIKVWQKNNNLAVDGQWGVNCWKKWTGVTK